MYTSYVFQKAYIHDSLIMSLESKNLLEAVQKDRLEEVVHRLDDLDEDVNTVFLMNRTALHCAVAKTNSRMVEVLLNHDVDVRTQDSNGNTALHITCSRSGPDSHRIVEMILARGGYDLADTNKFGRTVLEECVISNNRYAAELLINAGANKDKAKTLAVEKDNQDFVRLFGDNIIDVESDQDQAAGAAALVSPTLSIAEEKEALLKRLAELEEKERNDWENQLMEKKKRLNQVKGEFKKQIDDTQAAITDLESQMATLKVKMSSLKKEETKVVRGLSDEITMLTKKIDKKKIEKVKDLDVEGCLDCPVCLDLCKPPAEVNHF